MDTAMKKRLEAAGFVETTVRELLGLTPEEHELVETRLALSRLLRRLRAEQRLTQKGAAERARSDQANVSKAEKGDPSISLDWLIRTAYSLGASRQEVGRALCG
jgi:DNA-binding XRE family transcriptional regulator